MNYRLLSQSWRLLHMALIAAILSVQVALAETIVTLDDGRQVRLKSDHTWEWVEMDDSEDALDLLQLKLERLDSTATSCTLALRMKNASGYYVKSVVPQFSAMVAGNVPFETISRDFSKVKPLRSKYREVRFRGISCAEIEYVKVHGGDRCTMDDLDKFSANAGECLERIRVLPSDLLQMRK